MDGAEGKQPDIAHLAEQRLVGHQFDRLYAGLPAILVNLAVMPVVVGVAFWGSVSPTTLLPWVVASLVVLALRYALMKAYQRRPPGAQDALRWAHRFTFTSLVSGLLWGTAGWAFFTPDSAALQVFLYTSLVGLAAGSIIVTSYWLPAYFAFAVPAVGISALRLLMQGGVEYTSLAALMAMFLVIITRVARVQHAAGQSLVRLRDENVDLVERLSAEKSAVEAANHELDQRVRERTAELLEEVEVRKAAEQRLEHLAHHDPLTGLPNRLAFGHQLDRAIAQASRRQRRLALLFIDLDRFKEVNDSAGHNVGDRLLQSVAERLAYNLRLSDSLSRLGGDEFVCLLEDVVDGREAMRVADKMLALLASTFDVAGHEVHLSGSIGICVFPEDGTDRETLVRNADTAMFRAKAEGRGRAHFYTPAMTEAARRRLQMDAALRRAREAGELSLHYQIKVDREGRPAGAEALLRWNSAEFGPVPPSQFIPLAEDTGLIVRLGEWVLREACLRSMRWREHGLDLPSIAVNLSVKQLEHPEFMGQLAAVVEDSGWPTDRLELEITESMIMDGERAIDSLKLLREAGFGIAIDDFGTGYSSLAYLKRLPVTALKIDRSFVDGIGRGGGDEAIIRTVVALAQRLGCTTVAEGVETEEQRRVLLDEGVDLLQGYGLGRPMGAEAFADDWRARLAASGRMS
ncbi:putative bifunctional diguanylate cyclase/phosphodiesterase [Silanimonas sp.]|jgi:diguanylate cyclase (GGDEF)-like protein|uniref:putative bifunctional diguanylate cyclase/phosphodiesterase n=1 Tax=Silanimonas sp. TaxID=1929290 RepID=UPI0037C7B7B0